MPLEELFVNVKNNSSTEKVQSVIILAIRYLTETVRILI